MKVLQAVVGSEVHSGKCPLAQEVAHRKGWAGSPACPGGGPGGASRALPVWLSRDACVDCLCFEVSVLPQRREEGGGTVLAEEQEHTPLRAEYAQGAIQSQQRMVTRPVPVKCSAGGPGTAPLTEGGSEAQSSCGVGSGTEIGFASRTFVIHSPS